MRSKYISTILLIVIWSACQPDLPPEEAALQKLEKDLSLQPTPERANAYLDGVVNFVSTYRDDYPKIEPLLVKAVEVSETYELGNRKAGFMVPVLRQSTDPDLRKAYLLELGDMMYASSKTHASNVIFKSLASLYAEDESVATRMRLIDSVALETPDYVGYLFDQILIDPDEYGVNQLAAVRFIDAAEALALSNPQDSKVPGYVYKAAEVARSRRDLNKALNLYDWILEAYPNDENAPNVLFIKGFIVEQDLKQSDEARKLYETFLERYPDHEMAPSAKFLLENLGKSEQEILEMIEKSQQENSTVPVPQQ